MSLNYTLTAHEYYNGMKYGTPVSIVRVIFQVAVFILALYFILFYSGIIDVIALCMLFIPLFDRIVIHQIEIEIFNAHFKKSSKLQSERHLELKDDIVHYEYEGFKMSSHINNIVKVYETHLIIIFLCNTGTRIIVPSKYATEDQIIQKMLGAVKS